MQYLYDRYWGTFTEVLNGQTTTAIKAIGYSGRGPALNDVSEESEHEVGPIPKGSYTVDGPFNMGPNMDLWQHKSLGHGPVWELVPDVQNVMFGRSGFFIHGDNGERNHTASEGCVIVPPFYRNIFMKGDRIRVI